MFKTMGYSPGLLLEIGQFSTSTIHPKSTQTVAQAVTNHFRTVLDFRVSESLELFPGLAKIGHVQNHGL